MKFLKYVAIAALVAVSFTSCKKKIGSATLKNESDSLSYCLGVAIGANMKNMDVPTLDTKIFALTVNEMIAGKDPSITPEKANEFLNKYFMALQVKSGEKNKKDGEAFLAKNKERKEVITTKSGLQYEVLKEGNGAIPKIDDVVSVNYKGTLIDGTVFDSSYDRNEPASFEVGKIIPGWVELLQIMKVGSKYKAYIPSELAYGPRPSGKIKANSTLIFEIELLKIEPKDAKAKK
jgi:FKBP-type peptidyl-prolyl cis-trans isomerase